MLANCCDFCGAVCVGEWAVVEGVEVVCDSVSEDKQPSTKKSIAMITQEKVEEDLASTNALTER